jgi:hypothetical protein
MKKQKWLWANRFPKGGIGIIAGPTDLGKSTIAWFLAARITRGEEWTNGDGQAERGVVLILAGEDALATTIKPRLAAAGADMSMILALPVMVKDEMKGGERLLSLTGRQRTAEGADALVLERSRLSARCQHRQGDPARLHQRWSARRSLG